MPTFTDPRADPGRRQFTALHEEHIRARSTARIAMGTRPRAGEIDPVSQLGRVAPGS
jgi:hypothetical protein